MKDCSYKWTVKSYKESYIFHGKVSKLSPRIIRIRGFLIGREPIKKIWVQNFVFAIQHIGENLKLFIPRDQANLLHIVVVLYYTHHVKMACLVTGMEGCQNAQNKLL